MDFYVFNRLDSALQSIYDPSRLVLGCRGDSNRHKGAVHYEGFVSCELLKVSLILNTNFLTFASHRYAK